MSLETRIGNQLAELEKLILVRFKRIEDRLDHLEAELRRLERYTVQSVERLEQHDQRIVRELIRIERHELEDDREINAIERKNRQQDREIRRLQEQLKPHHYPATRAITFKPA